MTLYCVVIFVLSWIGTGRVVDLSAYFGSSFDQLLGLDPEKNYTGPTLRKPIASPRIDPDCRTQLVLDLVSARNCDRTDTTLWTN